MASTEQQIDDAVAKRHVQNTDSALGVQSADLDMNLHKIIGLEDPTGDKDAANKEYVDDHGSGSPGGSNECIQYNNSGSLGGDTDFKWTPASNILNFINAEIQSLDSVPGNFTLNSEPLNGKWTNWIYRGANVIKVRQAEVLPTSGLYGGEHTFLDALQINHYDTDLTNYETSNTQHEMHCVNIDMSGAVSSIQYKDMIGLSVRALGRMGWSSRGVAAITCETKQFGTGIAANEFHVFNPANDEGGYEQSTSMAGLQIVMKPHQGDEDSGHIYGGLLVNNYGKRITHGISLLSGSDDYGNGDMRDGISMGSATVTATAIIMPASRTGHVGTIIEYDSNDYSFYDRGANKFCFTIGGNIKLSIGSDSVDACTHKVINVVDPVNAQDVATKAYGDANWGGGSGYTNLTQFVDQTAWRLFYSNNLGDVIELALGTSGQFLKATGIDSIPIWDTPGGGGDVIGPAGATNNAVPLYDGTTGKLIKDSTRLIEDAMTDGSNIPDGHAVKTYGDANWGGGGSGDVVGPASAINNAIPLYDGVTGKLIKDSTRLIEDALTDGSNLPDGHAIKTYGNANWGSGVLKIAVVGDSLSQPTNFRDTWSSQFERLCDEMGLPVTVENYAVCGDRFYDAKHDHTEHESGTRSQVEQTIAHGADFVFVMLGVNDAIFSGDRTSSQIIADAQAVYNDLHAGLPLATIVYLEELPHNGGSLSPSSLTNGECLPYTHQLITYKGKSNCRVNNAAYTATSISSTYLTRYQTWGTASTSIRAIYDAYITINFWKIIRMGLAIDFIGHVDTFGHMMMAHYVLRWFKDHNGVDNKVLDVDIWTNDEKAVMDPDYFYDEVMAGTFVGASGGRYLEINDLLARAESWFYRQRYWMPYIGPEDLDSARNPISVVLKNCQVNRDIYISWDGGNLADTGKTTTSRGEFHHTWIGPELTTSFNWTIGTKELAYAVEVDDGSYDVYNVGITLTQPPHKSHVRYRRDASQSIPNGSFTIIKFNNKEYDTLTEYTSVNGRFTADEPGYYLISGGVTSDPVSWPSGKYWCVWIYKNGSMYACGDTHVADAAVYTVKSSYVNSSVYLGIGDYVDLRVYHSQGGYVNVRTDTIKQNYINIDRLTL